MSITATYTAETKLLIINNQTNSTRTSTIKNTELNLANISTPTNTNSAGTVTTSISLYDGNIMTATFPTTPYENYGSTYAFCGTLPTVISGTSTCLTIQSESCSTPGLISTSGLNSNNGVFTFPSHPPLPVGVQTDVDLSLDPRGWTYAAVIGEDCSDQDLIQPLFPDLSFWSCQNIKVCDSPAEVLSTALFLTVTSTSHEAGLAAQTPGPAAIPSPYNPPKSAQFASISPTTRVQLAPNNSPSPSTTVPNKLPDSNHEPFPNNQPSRSEAATISPLSVHQTVPNNQPAPNNQPVPSNQPGPNDQPASSQVAYNPPPRPTATVVPIAVASTNAQGSVALSTALAAAIPVFQTSTNNEGQNSVFTNFSPLTPDAPVTLFPQAVSSTNAQGSVFLATSNAVPVPTVITSTNSQGKAIATTSTKYSPVALNPDASPIAFIPTTMTTTNAQGITIVSTAIAAIIPIVASSTNSQGQTVLSSSLLTAAATASTNVVISSTNPQGSIILSTTQVPAVILTTNDAQGSQILTTSPIIPLPAAFTTSPPNSQQPVTGATPLPTLTPGGLITLSGTPISLAPSATALIIGSNTMPLNASPNVPPPPLTIGSQIFTANSATQYIIGSQTLTPGGVITVSGTRVSLAADDTAAVVGTSTEGLGPLITAGLGQGPGPSSGNGNGNRAPVSTGGARVLGICGLAVWLEGVMMLLGIGMVVGL
ncbi:hypothetical protein JMJ35_000606 [Cladonia borealis]|uniref:Uncharacterized protein n=1 Tax=Cladonia borealis TaxID=184061 RepID=A0AA39UFC8_9LECA|nr:hypothetical protein JMJ35_000606 [Cladonia borealis]